MVLRRDRSELVVGEERPVHLERVRPAECGERRLGTVRAAHRDRACLDVIVVRRPRARHRCGSRLAVDDERCLHRSGIECMEVPRAAAPRLLLASGPTLALASEQHFETFDEARSCPSRCGRPPT